MAKYYVYLYLNTESIFKFYCLSYGCVTAVILSVVNNSSRVEILHNLRMKQQKHKLCLTATWATDRYQIFEGNFYSIIIFYLNALFFVLYINK